MGCHGNIQALGADFSFLLANGPVDRPRPERAMNQCSSAITEKSVHHAYRVGARRRTGDMTVPSGL